MSSSKPRSEEHTSELQSRLHLVCRLLLEKKKKKPPRSLNTTMPRRGPSYQQHCVRTPVRASDIRRRSAGLLVTLPFRFFFFFFNDTATTEIYTLSPTRRSSD